MNNEKHRKLADQIRNENVGRLMLQAFRQFERLLLINLTRTGYGDLRMSHLVLVRNIASDGSRLTQIAEEAGMTKQAVGNLARELEGMGYIRRYPDPTDGRAKLVRFSGPGLEFVNHLPNVIQKTEQDLAGLIGKSEFKQLEKLLQSLILNSQKIQVDG